MKSPASHVLPLLDLKPNDIGHRASLRARGKLNLQLRADSVSRMQALSNLALGTKIHCP